MRLLFWLHYSILRIMITLARVQITQQVRLTAQMLNNTTIVNSQLRKCLHAEKNLEDTSLVPQPKQHK